MAAPLTPNRQTNMKIGSKIMFVKSPATVNIKQKREEEEDNIKKIDFYELHTCMICILLIFVARIAIWASELITSSIKRSLGILKSSKDALHG